MIYSDLVLFIIGEYIGDLKEASFDNDALKGALSSISNKAIKHTKFKLFKPITHSNSILLPFDKISKWMNLALDLKYNLYIKKYLDIYIFNWAMNAYDYKSYKSIEPFTKKCDKNVRERIICYRAVASSYFYYNQFHLKCHWEGHFVQLCKEAVEYNLKKILPTIVKLWGNNSKKFKIETITHFLKYSIQSNQLPLIEKIMDKIDFCTILNFEFERLLFECLKYNLFSTYHYCISKLTDCQPYLLKSVNTYSQLYELLKKKRVKIK